MCIRDSYRVTQDFTENAEKISKLVIRLFIRKSDCDTIQIKEPISTWKRALALRCWFFKFHFLRVLLSALKYGAFFLEWERSPVLSLTYDRPVTAVGTTFCIIIYFNDQAVRKIICKQYYIDMWITTVKSVSYTHLDVYKRQTLENT